jgi:hypothetical protein
MILRHKEVDSFVPAKLHRALELVHEITEELAPRFETNFSRPVIRRHVAEVILDLQGTTKDSDLRDIVPLVATFRLTSLIAVGDDKSVGRGLASPR